MALDYHTYTYLSLRNKIFLTLSIYFFIINFTNSNVIIIITNGIPTKTLRQLRVKKNYKKTTLK